MINFNKLLENLIGTEKESKLRKLVLAPLCLLSFFYGLAVWFRLFLYARGIFRRRSLPCKVVSVGNITLGGTGKTPLVCLLSEMIQARGHRVAILSRGYKGNFRGPFALVTDGERILMDAQQAGDEPYLLAEKLRGIPVIVGRERWLSGKYAIEQFRSEVLILDDGFQHLPLNRDLNLLLIDSSSPFGNGHLFPRGALREPLSQLSRADAIILTKVAESVNIKILKQNLEKILEGHLLFFQVDYAAGEIWLYEKKKSLPPESLKGKKILAFSGLAKPESFQTTLLSLGAEIVEFKTFPDHYWYDQKDAAKLWARAKERGVNALVTTEKDLVRMKGLTPGGIPLWTLSIRHFFPEQDQSQFEEFLFSRLGLGR
jgi:tetraacyldisaccharide 4'-kinase